MKKNLVVVVAVFAALMFACCLCSAQETKPVAGINALYLDTFPISTVGTGGTEYALESALYARTRFVNLDTFQFYEKRVMPGAPYGAFTNNRFKWTPPLEDFPVAFVTEVGARFGVPQWGFLQAGPEVFLHHIATIRKPVRSSSQKQ